LLLSTKPEEDPWKILTDQNLYLWGVDRFDTSDGKVLWTSGKFRTFAAAERYRQKCLTQHKDAIVLAFKNGVPEIDLR
jgi:hypothetical protein